MLRNRVRRFEEQQKRNVFVAKLTISKRKIFSVFNFFWSSLRGCRRNSLGCTPVCSKSKLRTPVVDGVVCKHSLPEQSCWWTTCVCNEVLLECLLNIEMKNLHCWHGEGLKKSFSNWTDPASRTHQRVLAEEKARKCMRHVFCQASPSNARLMSLLATPRHSLESRQCQNQTCDR